MTHTALLVLDFINDIVHLEGKFRDTAKFVHEHHVMDHANKVIAFARAKHIPIVFVRVGFSSGYVECPMHSPLFGQAKEHHALALNTWGTEFHEKMNTDPQDLVITKHRVSAFYGTPLETFLRANQIQNLILIGVSTDLAVQTTARDAHDRDYRVSVISDACGSGSMDFHASALKGLGKIARVISSKELITNI
jgi:nicotinamidase-related amidase